MFICVIVGLSHNHRFPVAFQKMESWFNCVYVPEKPTIRRTELYPRNWKKQLRQEATGAPVVQSFNYASRVRSGQTYLGSHPDSSADHLNLAFGKFIILSEF